MNKHDINNKNIGNNYSNNNNNNNEMQRQIKNAHNHPHGARCDIKQ